MTYVGYKYAAKIFVRIAKGFAKSSDMSSGSKLLMTFPNGVDKGQACILSVIS